MGAWGPQVAQKASPSVRRVTAVRPQPRVRVVVRATQGEEEPVFDTLKTSTGDEVRDRNHAPWSVHCACGARHR
jgi:hypothetical protein